jgi:Protein of unknown function (DUF3168)
VSSTIPDSEKIVGDYLRTHAAVVATGARITGRTPEDRATPWVRLTQLDASNQVELPVDRLITYLIQLDCYAGAAGLDGSQQKQASLVARTVRDALDDLNETNTILGGTAIITRVRFANGPFRSPDTVFEPARERFILDTLVTMHEI